MKKLLYLALPVALGLGACNMAGDDDYENMANDMCDCVNKSTADVPQGVKKALSDAAESNKDLQQTMMDYFTENPADALAFQQAMTDALPKIEKCGEDIEKKYDNVYTNENEDEIQKHMLEVLEKNKSCGWTYSLMKMGMESK